MRVTVVGKGGSGKSTIAGLICSVLAQDGERVLALDADLSPGLPQVLGIDPGETPMLVDAGGRKANGPWAPKMSAIEMLERYSIPGPHGIRFLQFGKVGRELTPALSTSFTAFYRTFRGFDRPGWWVVADLAAGTMQTSTGFTGGSGVVLLVTEPSQKSWLTTRRVTEIVRFWGATPLAVANKIGGPSDSEWMAEHFSSIGLPLWAEIPADPAIVEAERNGTALVALGNETPVMQAVKEMAGRLSLHFEDGSILAR